MDQSVIFKLIMYFIIYSFFGWVLESVFKTYLQKKLVNSGFLHGPVCTIYGVGALIMLLFLDKFRGNIIAIFIIGFVVLSVWEYIVGVLLEKIFKTKYWDYSDNKFNFQGRVCLMNSIFWGILAVIFIQFVHPFISMQVDKIPNTALIVVTSTIMLGMLVDFIVTIVRITNIQSKVEKLREITEKLNEQLKQMKKTEKNKALNMEAIQSVVNDLKHKQTKIKRRLYRTTNRLRKAFPTMKSETIEKIGEMLNQKIEIKKIKK